jgi:NADPH:quinone reductase-like Zn-dependent oxidoreductase
MPSNHAAWVADSTNKPLEVGPAPYTRPGENEIVIRNHAVAINPIDWMKRDMGSMMFSWIRYPFILGNDCAGEVVEVGSGDGSKRFKPGDRVLGLPIGMDKRSNKASEGAYQEYVVLRHNLASQIPNFMSYEQACVLPLALSTAATGLFTKDCLGLQLPSLNPTKTGETLLVWGASTSVGCNAVQLAVSAGYEVIATASRKHFDYVKKLGAVEVFDFRAHTITEDLVAAFKGKKCAGAIAIGRGSTVPCIKVVAAADGRKFVAQASLDGPEMAPTGVIATASAIYTMVSSTASIKLNCLLKSVGTKFFWASDLMTTEVGKAIYEDFLPQALQAGKYVAAPEPIVVGKGLEAIEIGLSESKKGVSAKKIVVSLTPA